MTGTSPSLVTQTKLDYNGTSDVKVVSNRTVTYTFQITSTSKLNFPYAVSVGGEIRDEFQKKPKVLNTLTGSITVNNVPSGSEVKLFLNSDAHVAHRKQAVYAVTPSERDVTVKIKERSGKHTDTDTPVLQPKTGNSAADKIDTYKAALTGDIWMKITHKYAASEVASLVPKDTPAFILEAVQRIYNVLPTATLTIDLPLVPPDTQAKKISITFLDSDNATDNIHTGYTMLKEGLCRVHPAGYVAVFEAAVHAGVDKVAMTSAWRPMKGSIAHRAGLGLDVNFVGPTRLNRQELRNAGPDTTNVSEEEKRLFADFEQSKRNEAEAARRLKAANVEAKKAKITSNLPGPASQELEEAQKDYKAAEKKRKEDEAAWNNERNKNESAAVRKFREHLAKHAGVAQLFDPWYMDENTRDDRPATPNLQESHDENAKLHSHHLHVTVYEPNIL